MTMWGPCGAASSFPLFLSGRSTAPLSPADTAAARPRGRLCRPTSSSPLEEQQYLIRQMAPALLNFLIMSFKEQSQQHDLNALTLLPGCYFTSGSLQSPRFFPSLCLDKKNTVSVLPRSRLLLWASFIRRMSSNPSSKFTFCFWLPRSPCRVRIMIPAATSGENCCLDAGECLCGQTMSGWALTTGLWAQEWDISMLLI